jgi:hypothetical protein
MNFKRGRRNSAMIFGNTNFSLGGSFNLDRSKTKGKKKKKEDMVTLYDLIGTRIQSRLKGLVTS